MCHNGPAIWGGCVSAPIRIFLFKVRSVTERNGALFASQGTSYLRYTSVAPRPGEAERSRGCKVDREQVTSQGTQSFIAGTGAVAVQAITNLSRV